MNRLILDQPVADSHRLLCAVWRHLRAANGKAALSVKGEHGEARCGRMNKEARSLWGCVWKFEQTGMVPAQLGREVGWLWAHGRPECV